jgi:hypothetical protein
VRTGLGAAFGVVAVASVFFTLLLFVSYATVVGLFESLGPSVVGLVVLFVGQLALIPNFVIWLTSWLIGPGFSLGSGAQFSPLGTDIQAVPALPVLGALPTNVDSIGFSLVALPVFIAVIAAVLARRAGADMLSGQGALFTAMTTLATSAIATVVAVATLSVPALLASGALGPGRFSDVGIVGSDFALWWGAEVLVGSLLGALAAQLWWFVRLQDQAYSTQAAR